MKDHPLIIICEQDATEQFEPQVERIVAAMGHPEALVTDESQVFDFFPCICVGFDDEELARAHEEEARQVAQLRALLGRDVTGRERIWELGRELALLEDQARQRSNPH